MANAMPPVPSIDPLEQALDAAEKNRFQDILPFFGQL